MNKQWTLEEDQKLIKLYPETKTQDLSNLLGRTLQAVRQRAFQLKVKADRAYHHLANPELNQYESLTEAERAYIAGIVDGEGSIGIYNRCTKNTETKRYIYALPKLSIHNTNKQLIDWLHQRLGGCVHKSNHRAKPQHSPCWGLDIQGNLQLKKLLTVILPYLIIKKDKALTILNHHTIFEYANGRRN